MKTLERNLGLFLKTGGVDEVHDVRVALRRADAYFDLLPKRIRRSKEAEETARKRKRLMKRTAAIRDLDAIRSKVSGGPRGAGRGRLLRGIGKERRKLIKKANESAISLRRSPAPALTADGVQDAELGRRFDKIVRKLTARMNKLVPLVVGDPSKLKELHRLRIDCKQLRYTYELAESSGRSEELAFLRELQDALGVIHDSDVAIAHLKAVSPPPEALLEAEGRKRDLEFRGFVRLIQRGPGLQTCAVQGGGPKAAATLPQAVRLSRRAAR